MPGQLPSAARGLTEPKASRIHFESGDRAHAGARECENQEPDCDVLNLP